MFDKDKSRYTDYAMRTFRLRDMSWIGIHYNRLRELGMEGCAQLVFVRTEGSERAQYDISIDAANRLGEIHFCDGVKMRFIPMSMVRRTVRGLAAPPQQSLL